jgi:hypothetical protein
MKGEILSSEGSSKYSDIELSLDIITTVIIAGFTLKNLIKFPNHTLILILYAQTYICHSHRGMPFNYRLQ